jgi:two-component system nitrate/nitrite response regulator NarL
MIEADSSAVRASLESVLDAEEDVVVVASARDADVILVAADRARLRDELPSFEDAGLDGLSHRAATLVLLDRIETDAVRDAFTAGANAVLTIDASGEELIAAIRAVALGLSVMPSATSAELMSHLRVVPPTAEPSASRAVALTPREREVLALLAGGLANKVIAARLGITEHTVKTHIAAVYEKLDASNRAEAVVAAARQGMLML